MATANATVMFTDIRGFTARTSRDTRVGLEELLSTHENLLLPVIKHYDGRVVKTIGDAFLVVFESPTNAVLCGVVIQRRLHLFNQTAEDDKKIEVRVAINSGEVTLRGDDVFGEPVNICARIEGITEPNEIYFTEATYLTMQKAEVPSSEVGTRRLKGIPEEIKLYKVIQDENNELYMAIISHAEIADDTAAVAGSLSIPQWPPPRGKLEGAPAGSNKGIFILIAALALMAVAFFATQAWRESVRYDGVKAALEAKQWRQAQELAGELWGQRGDDQMAIKLLTEAITHEIDDLVAAGDIQALQDRWTTVKRGWGNLPAKADLERRVNRAKLEMQIATGDAAGAIDALQQLWEADKADVEVPKLIVAGLTRVLLVDFEALAKDRPARAAWHKRLEAYTTTYKDLPGFAPVRADAQFGLGMVLTLSENNFVKDEGLKLLNGFLQENPEDRERAFAIQLRKTVVNRWGGSPHLLLPYLEEKPERAKAEGVRDAVMTWLSGSYDFDDKEDIAVRAMVWQYWGAEVGETLHEWIATGSEKQRLNAFFILKDAGEVRDDEQDAVYSWMLLQRSGSFHNDEFGLALDHWLALVRANPDEAKARANAAVPKPLLNVANLSRGVSPVRNRKSSPEEWLEIVNACFYTQIKGVALNAVTDSRYASERKTARLLLRAHGELTEALESASHLYSLAVWNYDPPAYTPSDVDEAVAWFVAVDFRKVHDRAKVTAALGETADIAGDKIAAVEQAAAAGKLKPNEARRRIAEWKAFQALVKTAATNVNQQE
ncbi:MAG: adenylate/guanylate cyclase domain-containing protein [Planctomycetota bacterium]|jgi:class 3 adenylate cyclase